LAHVFYYGIIEAFYPTQSMGILDNLLKLVGTPRDGALLRFSLGNELLKAGEAAQAIVHLRVAVEKDPRYSAAWKVLGKALVAADQPGEALACYHQGIAIAEAHGDIQAAKEMRVFARRLERTPNSA
jgi:predicted Zn-dependent protease